MIHLIQGKTITLYEKVEQGVDEFNQPVITEIATLIDNVLILPASSEDIVDSLSLYGKKAVYTLAIPKSDTHNWENVKVSFFGKEWRTFGIPTEGIEENIPLSWNKKVQVERHE